MLQASEGAVGLPAGPDGQLGGRAPQPRRGPAGAPGPAAHRRGDPRRLVRGAARAARGLRAGARDRAPAHRRPGRPGRRPRQRPPPASRSSELAARRGRRRRSASTRCSTAATRRRRSALGFVARPRGASSPPRIRTRGSRRSAAATGRWTATSAGSGSSAATTPSSTAAGEHAAVGDARRSRRPTRAARPTSSSRPTVIDGTDGRLRDGDPSSTSNFRADRARQLTHALAEPSVRRRSTGGAAGEPAPRDVLVVTMTEYEAGLPVGVAFAPEEARSLAQAFSEAGWTQFHVAETEKYAHVTYFFNGGREAAVARRGATAGAEPEGRDLRPPARDERGRASPTRSSPRSSRAGTTSSSRTTPTPTWSATPGSGTRRSARSRRSTRLLGRVADAVARVEAADPAGPGAALADHRRPRQRGPDARRGRQPDDGPLAQPRPAAGRVGRALEGRALHDGVLADVAPTILELAGLPALGRA